MSYFLKMLSQLFFGIVVLVFVLFAAMIISTFIYDPTFNGGSSDGIAFFGIPALILVGLPAVLASLVFGLVAKMVQKRELAANNIATKRMALLWIVLILAIILGFAVLEWVQTGSPVMSILTLGGGLAKIDLYLIPILLLIYLSLLVARDRKPKS